MAPDRIFSRREIEGLIANGDSIIITQNNVLRLNAWHERHPGGHLVIRHMVGREATDELNISHSQQTLATVNRYRIGRVEGPWVNFTPPIQGGVFRPLKDKHDTARLDTEDSSEESSDEAASDSGRSVASSRTSVDVEDIDLISVPDRMTIATGSESTAQAFAFLRSKEKHVNTDESTAHIKKSIQDEVDNDRDHYPSLDAETQHDIAIKFRALHERVRNEGYYDLRVSEYIKEMIRYSILFAGFIYCLRQGWIIASATCLGFFWQQIMFTAHDAGHRAITHNIIYDTLIGIFIGDFCCGLSIGWWKSSHNVHHLVTNSPEHDPDIQNVPLFSTSPSFMSSIQSSYYGICFPWDKFAEWSIKYQKYTYYPVMAIARFNLYFLSWAHLISTRANTKSFMAWTRPTEVCAIALYSIWYYKFLLYDSIPTWKLRALFLLVSHVATLPLHVQITLSHWGTSTADLGPRESFAMRQLRTTMDIACPAWLDFVHGGLQFQAVHHLFPRVPRHNLRRLQTLVREFAAETGIDYQIKGFVAANKHMLGRLDDITQLAKLLAECQAHMAETGESGLH
ncbi:hypothetical protein LTR62_005070 [Meristemomyces frigidus]|uniref:Delta 8-(E)-sphingolipid desaturase n=1 Tax=Meristemomyces frigidus TaxID=1508187 RepID=A0AAN7YN02_9PEZI|nr:hypothetical protein LTR62_005070 [Meristemomyces frigidus]